METENTVRIYTNGDCPVTGSSGGWAYSIRSRELGRLDRSGGFVRTTNIRMDMYAIIEGLRSLPRNSTSNIIVLTDAEYVSRAFSTGRALEWRENGWMLSRKHRVKYPDLWHALMIESDCRRISIEWMPAYPCYDNDVGMYECERMAVQSQQSRNSAIDQGYELECSGMPWRNEQGPDLFSD